MIPCLKIETLSPSAAHAYLANIWDDPLPGISI